MNPLTHHDIMALAAPFAHSGRHVDLAASDRLKRRLAFKPVDRAAGMDVTTGASGATSMPSPGMPPLREQLSLENASPGWFRLSRTLALPDGQCAELHCEGDEPAVLLAAVLAVPAQRQLPIVDGQRLVLRHRLDAASGRFILTHAQTAVAGLQLSMTVSRVSGISAEVELVAAPDENFELPEDLLSVLGLPWSRLSHKASTWCASIVLRGDACKAHAGCRNQVRAHRGAPGDGAGRYAGAVPSTLCACTLGGGVAAPDAVARGDGSDRRCAAGAALEPGAGLGVSHAHLQRAAAAAGVAVHAARDAALGNPAAAARHSSSRGWRAAGPAPGVPKDAPTTQATR